LYCNLFMRLLMIIVFNIIVIDGIGGEYKLHG